MERLYESSRAVSKGRFTARRKLVRSETNSLIFVIIFFHFLTSMLKFDFPFQLDVIPSGCRQHDCCEYALQSTHNEVKQNHFHSDLLGDDVNTLVRHTL